MTRLKLRLLLRRQVYQTDMLIPHHQPNIRLRRQIDWYAGLWTTVLLLLLYATNTNTEDSIYDALIEVIVRVFAHRMTPS